MGDPEYDVGQQPLDFSGPIPHETPQQRALRLIRARAMRLRSMGSPVQNAMAAVLEFVAHEIEQDP